MIKKICTAISLFLVISCVDEDTKQEILVLKLENIIHIDNYYLWRTNRDNFNLIDSQYKVDSLNYKKKYLKALELNMINKELVSFFTSTRNEFISSLKGNETFFSDTMKLEQVKNRKSLKLVEKYFSDTNQNKMDQLYLFQKRLDRIFPSNGLCDLGKIEDLWIERKISPMDFIIQLTMTENLLYKKINCLYDRMP